MVSQRAGDGGSLRPAQEGVARPGEMNFIEGIELGKGPYQGPAAFAEEGPDLVPGGQDVEELLKRATVHGRAGRLIEPRVVVLRSLRGEQVNGTTRTMEYLVSEVELPRVRGDAPQRLAGLSSGGMVIDMLSASRVPRPTMRASARPRIFNRRWRSRVEVKCAGSLFTVEILPSAEMAKLIRTVGRVMPLFLET